MLSKPSLELLRPFLSLYAVLGLLAFGGCASQASQPPLLSIPVAETLRAPCPSAKGAESVRTIGELAAFSILQQAALVVCDGYRSALVQTVDAHNALAAQMVAKPRKRFLGLF